MLKKIIITLFTLLFFLLPGFAFAVATAEEGTLVVSITDTNGSHPAGSLAITNTETKAIITKNISEGKESGTFVLPVGSYKIQVTTDKKYDTTPPQIFAISTGETRSVSVTPSFTSPVSSGKAVNGLGATSGTGTITIGILEFNKPAIFTGAFGDNFTTLDKALPAIFNIIISASGIIFIVLFFIGGIQYLSSAGNEEATKKAKALLIDAVIGLIIVLASWAIGSWILINLGVK